MPKILRAVLAAAALGLARDGGAAALGLPGGGDRSSFSFSIAGIRVGAASFAFEQSGASYSASTRIDTAGVVGMFTDFFFDGQASGRLASGGKVVPQLFTATSKSPRALRKSRIEWKDGTPVKVSVEPPRDSAPDPAEQGGTLDPVSASLRLLARRAGERGLQHDGHGLRRLAGLAAQGGGRRWRRTGGWSAPAPTPASKGEASSMVGAREFPFSITFGRTSDGMATLERIEAPTNFGQAVVARMD